MHGLARASASSLASRLTVAVSRGAGSGARRAAAPRPCARCCCRAAPCGHHASDAPLDRARAWLSWSSRTRRDVHSAVVARASPSSDRGGRGGGGGGGFLPNAPRSVPPPTPKRVGPRQTKKRFTGEDALTPQERKAKDAEVIRLAKALARLGVASRRASEALVFAGRVTVNGAVVTAPQHSVSLQRDVVAVDGKVVDGGLARDDAHYYFLLNKPKGYLCSNKAAAGRGKDGGGDGKLVLDLFEDFREGWRKKHPGKLPPRLFTVGRLDVNTTGMLLVTTDGQWCQRVAHPSSEVVKSYIVTASSRPTKAQLKTMSEGAVVDGAKVTPTRVESLQGARDGGPANRVLVEVVDGRNREVREIAASAGVMVKKLKRVRVGGLRMPSELPIGKYVSLKPHQVGYVLDKGLAFNDKAEAQTGQMGKSW